MGCHSLLQGIFPTQGWNPGLLHCRRTLYHLSHQGSPRTPEEGLKTRRRKCPSLRPGSRSCHRIASAILLCPKEAGCLLGSQEGMKPPALEVRLSRHMQPSLTGHAPTVRELPAFSTANQDLVTWPLTASCHVLPPPSPSGHTGLLPDSQTH